MVNGGGGTVLELSITGQGETATECEVMGIAYDGIYLNQATPLKLKKALLVATGRLDWLIVCNEPGVYEVPTIYSIKQYFKT